MRLVVRSTVPRWSTPVAVVTAAVLTALLLAIPIRVAGANPWAAFERYLILPLSSASGLAEVVLTATPLLFTGAAVALAFKGGYWNIGAEGQFLAGAVAVTGLALQLPHLPAAAALPLGLLAGASGGVVWALLPAWLKRRGGIDEVVTTLLLNPVALLVVQGLLNGPWRNSTSGFTDSDRFGRGWDLPALLPGSRVHVGVVVALLIIIGIGVTLSRTTLGLRLRAIGEAPQAAAFSGLAVPAAQWRVALASGAIAGIGGAVQVMGVGHQLTQAVSADYGYTGVVVATLAGLSATGIVLVSLLLGDVAVGAQNVSLVLQVPTQLGAMFNSLLLLLVLAALGLRRYRLVRSSR